MDKSCVYGPSFAPIIVLTLQRRRFYTSGLRAEARTRIYRISPTAGPIKMNSERRHDLQENELASALGKINQSIDPYSKPIAVAVVIGFVGSLAWGFYSSGQAGRRSDATYQLIEASVSNDSETLATVAAQYAETPAAAWSRLYQGSSKMGVGINALFTSREEAEELLSEASAAYQEALKLSDDTIIQSRAHFGLARISESLGNVDEAIENYEAAMTVGESDAMVEEAKQKIASLSKPQTQEFLAWFNDQDFAPANPAAPPSLPGAGQLPDLPDLDFGDMDDEEEAPVSEEAPATKDETGESSDEPTADEETMLNEPAVEEQTAQEQVVEEVKEAAPETEAAADKNE